MVSKTIEPYSKVINLPNGLILFSGIKAWGLLIDNSIKGSIQDQAIDIFKQFDKIFEEEKILKSELVKVQCFLTNIEDYSEFNNLYLNWIGKFRPCRSVIGVHELRFAAKIELVIECFRN